MQLRIDHNRLASLAMAGAFLFATSAWADTGTVTTHPGDLILAFRATDSTLMGYTSNLTVDLGSASLFYNAAGTGETLSLSALAVADLAATYGENWSMRTDLVWGILGGYTAGYSDNHAPQYTIWASSPQLADGSSTAWMRTVDGRSNTNAQSIPASKISGIAGYAGDLSSLGSLNGSAQTENSSSAAVIDNSLSYSWTNVSSDGVFDHFTSTIENTADIMDSPSGYVASDLYELLPIARGGTSEPGTLLGTFQLSEEGLSFVTVPEPSTYALGAMGVGLLLLVSRKRTLRGRSHSLAAE